MVYSFQENLCQSYVEKAIALLKRQNELVATHPNSHVYSQLLSLVDFDGFYLESEPCLVCNDPEVAFTVSVWGGGGGEGGSEGGRRWLRGEKVQDILSQPFAPFEASPSNPARSCSEHPQISHASTFPWRYWSPAREHH